MIKRFDYETFEDYMIRLFENKAEYGLTCDKIADILNDEPDNTNPRGSCAYRKEYAAFNRGRIYEREKGRSGIALRVLSISDLHVPFQHPVEVFKDYVGCVDLMQINGDVVDGYSISKFPKAYRKSPMEEIIAAREYLISLIEYIQPKKVAVTYGNHDQRLQNYLVKNLDTDILELMPLTALELIIVDGFHHYDKETRTKTWYEPLANIFDNIEIEYANNWFWQVGEVIFAHPLAFKSAPMKTANDAMLWFRNEGYKFSTLVMAHTHRLGQYIVGNTALYEQGACCKTDSMMYNDGKLVNSQKQGFIYLCLDKDGKEMRDFTKLVCLN